MDVYTIYADHTEDTTANELVIKYSSLEIVKKYFNFLIIINRINLRK